MGDVLKWIMTPLWELLARLAPATLLLSLGTAMSQILSVLMFVAVGFLILAAAVWYITTLHDVFFGEKPAVLGEIKVLGRLEIEAKSIETGLPRLIVAELRRQRDELNTAVSELKYFKNNPSPRVQPQVVNAFSTDIVRLFNKTVYPDLKIGGVDATGIVKFFTDQLPAGDVLSLSVSFTAKSDAAPERTLVYGHQTGERGYSFVAPVPKHGIDDVASAVAASIMAHEIRRIESAFEALTGKEFEQLLALLKRYSDIVRRGAFASIAPAEYLAVLNELEPLAKKYNRWEGLQRLTLRIADQAGQEHTQVAAARALQGILSSRLSETLSESDRSAIRTELVGLQAKLTARPAETTGIVRFCGADRDKRFEEAYRPILATIGLTTKPTVKGTKIAVVGGVPSRTVLDQISHEIVGASTVPSGPSGYLASLVSVACQLTPDVTFVFASIDATGDRVFGDSSLLKNINDLMDANPDVLLFTYSHGDNEESVVYRHVFERLAALNVVVVTAAGNEGASKTAAYFKENAAGLRVAATDSSGRPTSFSKRDAEVVWAPGENLLVVTEQAGTGNLQLDVSSGTSWSAAVAAASAAFLRSEVKSVTPAQLRKALFETSRRLAGEVAVIDVGAALAALRPKQSK